MTTTMPNSLVRSSLGYRDDLLDFSAVAEWIRQIHLPGVGQVQDYTPINVISNVATLGSASTIEIRVADGLSSSSFEFMGMPGNFSYVTASWLAGSSANDLLSQDVANNWSNVFDPAAPFALFRAKVIAWSKLEPDWDGEDGVAPSAATVSNALDFIDLIEKSSVPVPTIYIAGDGELGFRWRIGDARASVSFLDDGNVVGFCPEYCGLPAVDVDAPYNLLQSNPDVSRLLNSIRVRFR